MTSKVKDITKEEWRQLGFYYDRDDTEKYWTLSGSPTGLKNFTAALRAYTNKPAVANISEHEHFGPYMYLKVMTWHEPGISRDSIHGASDDLRSLAHLVELASTESNIGQTISIGKNFHENCEYDLRIQVVEYGADVAAMDRQLWE